MVLVGKERFPLKTEQSERKAAFLETNGSYREWNASNGVVVFFKACIYELRSTLFAKKKNSALNLS
jgi:hypothetical protein